MLNTAYESDQQPAAPDPVRIAAHNDTCLFFGCEDLDAAYRQLRENGVKLKEPRVAPYGMKQLSFKDPEIRAAFSVAGDAGDARQLVKAYGIEPKTVP